MTVNKVHWILSKWLSQLAFSLQISPLNEKNYETFYLQYLASLPMTYALAYLAGEPTMTIRNFYYNCDNYISLTTCQMTLTIGIFFSNITFE